ncbi:MAG: adenylosuccinate synthase [bacterium]
MPAIAVVGAQWGDEGKGKVVDYLGPEVDWAVRYQGGANAGHTVVVGDTKTVLHLVPSAILNPRVRCVIASGVVLDPIAFLDEVALLEAAGVAVAGRLVLSNECHLVLPHHKAIDVASERALGSGAIGTTGRGIGPAYTDRASRRGVRAGELLDRARFASRIAHAHDEGNAYLERYLNAAPLPGSALDALRDLPERLAPFVADTGALVRGALARGEKVLLEGAQGTLLDLDHGTYPFVTSSNTTAAAAAVSAGIAPWAIGDVLAVMKAYTTRVGSGPFPCELSGEVADTLVTRGAEFGATTGRRRRVGWFDGPAARYAADLNGATALAITKLDVLDHLARVPVCVAYDVNGTRTTEFPHDVDSLAAAKPVLEELPGWQEPTSGARTLDDLPRRAREYLDAIAAAAGAPLALVSVGSGRDATFHVRETFRATTPAAAPRTAQSK